MLKVTLEFINIECETHRRITESNPIFFTFEDQTYKGYRQNGFVIVTRTN